MSDDFDLDEFDYDDDFDFGIEDFGGDPPKDDRTPVQTAKDIARKSTVKMVTDGHIAKSAFKKFMPKGYIAGIDKASDLKYFTSDVTSTIAKELEPVASSLKTMARGAHKSIEKFTPAWLNEKIKGMTEEQSYSSYQQPSKEEQRENAVKDQLAAIFESQLKVDEERRQQDQAEDIAKETAEEVRHKSTSEYLRNMALSLDRMRSFQDNVGLKVQSKSLELQMKQYLLLTDHANLSAENASKITTALTNIQKNTALPEAQKITQSENTKQEIRDAISKGMVNSFKGFHDGYGKRLTKNLADSIKGVNQKLSLAATMSETASGMDMSSFGGDSDSAVTDLASEGAANLIVNGINKYKDSISKNKYASKLIGSKFGQKAGKAIKYGNEKITDLTNLGAGSLETARKGMLNSNFTLLKIIGDILPAFSEGRDELKRDYLDQLNQPATLDGKMYHSITDAIPGYLHSINRWMQMLVTQEYVTPGASYTYDWTSGKFTSKGDVQKRIKEIIFGNINSSGLQKDIETAKRDTLGGLELSNELNSKYNVILTKFFNSGQAFDHTGPFELINIIENDSKLSADERETLIKAIRERYNLDSDIWTKHEYTDYMPNFDSEEHPDLTTLKGKLKHKRNTYKGIGKATKENLKTLGKRTDLTKDTRLLFKRISEKFDDPSGAIAAIHEAVGLEAMSDLGLIITDNTGKSRINTDAIEHIMLTGELPVVGSDYEQDIAESINRSFKTSARFKNRGGVASSATTVPSDNPNGIDREDVKEILKGMRELAAPLENISESFMRKSAIEEAREKLAAKDDEILSSNLEELIRIRTTLEHNATLGTTNLEKHGEAIIAALMAASSANGEPGGETTKFTERYFGKAGGGIFKLAKTGVDKTVGLTKSYFKWWGERYKDAGKAVTAIGSAGVGVLGGGLDKLKNRTSSSPDVYVSGEFRPRLTGKLIDNVHYYDYNTKEPIATLDDITGEVREIESDRIVLTKEDYDKGLVNSRGKSIVLKGWNAAKTYTGLVVGAYAGAGKLALKTVSRVGKWLTERKDKVRDAFFPGEDKPRIIARLLEQGNYYYDTVSKKFISSYDEISGNLLDKDGNLVVTIEEIRKNGGFKDIWGKSIDSVKNSSILENIVTTAGGWAKTGVEAYAKAVKTVYKGVWNTLKKAGGWVGSKLGIYSSSIQLTGDADKDLLQVGHAQLSVQEKILELLTTVHADKLNRSIFDKSGDGMRDGDWRSRVSENEDETVDADGEPKRDRKRGTDAWDAIKDKANSAKDWIKKRLGYGVEDALDGLDDGDRRRRRRGRGRSRGGRGGRLSRMGRGIRTGASSITGRMGGAGTALRRLGMFGGDVARGIGRLGGAVLGKSGIARTAAGAVVGKGGLLRTAGTAIASVVGIKAVVVGAAVAGVGYGAYKLYKHLTRARNPMFELRVTQYGVKPTNETAVKAILELETMVAGAVKYNEKDGASIDGNRIDVRRICEVFGIKVDGSNQERLEKDLQPLLAWFANRFQPIFIVWETARRKHAGDISLSDFDSKLKATVALKILEEVELPNHDAYKETTNPGKGIKINQNARDVRSAHKYAVKQMKKKAKSEPADKEESKNVDGSPVPTPTAAKQQDEKDTKEEIKEEVKKMKAEGESDDKPADKPSMIKSLASNYAKYSAIGLAASTSKKLSGFIGDKFKEYTKSKWFKATPFGAGIAAVTSATNYIKSSVKTQQSKYIMDRGVPPLQAVRMMTYGLTELEASKILAIKKLEEWAFQNIEYRGGVAYFASDSMEALRLFAPAFSNGQPSDTWEAGWVKWFNTRFLMTMLGFATLVRQTRQVDPTTADRVFLPEQALPVAEGLSSITSDPDQGSVISVWEMRDSPWQGYHMNADIKSVGIYIDIIRDGIKNDVLSAIGEKPVLSEDAANRISAHNLPAGVKADGFLANLFKRGKGGVSALLSEGWEGLKSTASKATNAVKNFFSGGDSQWTPDGAVMSRNGPGVRFFEGTGGDLNQLPNSLGSGMKNNIDLITAAAKMVGVDPSLAASMAGMESGFKPGAGAKTSSAKGMYQFTNDTWNYMMKNHAARFGIPPGTSVYDPKANTVLGLQYIKDNIAILRKNFGQDYQPQQMDLYLMHFLGPNGGVKFLKKAFTNPDARVSTAVSPSAYTANAGVFKKGGSNGVERSIASTVGELQRRMDEQRALHAHVTERGEYDRSEEQHMVLDDGSSKQENYKYMQGPGFVEHTGDVMQAKWNSEQDLSPSYNVQQYRNEVNVANTGQPVSEELTSISDAHMAGGDYADPEGGLANLPQANTKGGNITQVHPTFLRVMMSMANEYHALTGKKINLNESFRSYAHQADLYKRFGSPRAARPGRSPHEHGFAVDVNTPIANELEKLGLLKKYGLTRPIGGETWHLEPVGLQSNPEFFKANRGLMGPAILAGLGKGGGGYGARPKKPLGGRDLNRTPSVPMDEVRRMTKSGADILANQTSKVSADEMATASLENPGVPAKVSGSSTVTAEDRNNPHSEHYTGKNAEELPDFVGPKASQESTPSYVSNAVTGTSGSHVGGQGGYGGTSKSPYIPSSPAMSPQAQAMAYEAQSSAAAVSINMNPTNNILSHQLAVLQSIDAGVKRLVGQGRTASPVQPAGPLVASSSVDEQSNGIQNMSGRSVRDYRSELPTSGFSTKRKHRLA